MVNSKGKYKILFIEDEELVNLVHFNMLETLFKKDKVKIFNARNGEEGKNILKTEEIDILIVDWMLPGELDGLKLLKWVKKDKNYGSSFPVVFFTAVSEPSNISRALKEGCDEYLLKNGEILELRASLKKFIPEEIFTPEEEILTSIENYSPYSLEDQGKD